MKNTFFLLGGVIIPLVSAGFELVTGIGAGTLFDPFANLLMIPAVLSVPLILFYYWNRNELPDDPQKQYLLSAGLGWSMGISGYYCFVIGPFAAPAVIGILFLVGLMALSPFFTLWAAAVGSTRMLTKSQKFRPGFAGVGAALLFLLMVEGPSWFTLHQLSKLEKNHSPEQIEAVVRKLRLFGSKKTCLNLSRGFSTENTSPALFATGWAFRSRRPGSPNAALIYFRLTGDSVSKASAETRRNFFNLSARRFNNDPSLGGDEVAHQIEGLSLHESSLEANLNVETGLLENQWTLQLKNRSQAAQEGRFEVSLPQGSFVSGLHLWVNGEPQTAAFAAKEKVTAAYRSVAVVRRKDPVLVRWAGPDRLFVQCFPVPANGGVIKFRIEYLTELTSDAIASPAITNQNFAIDSQFRHDIKVMAPNPFTTAREEIQLSKRPRGGHVLMGLLSNEEMIEPSPLGHFPPTSNGTTVWTEDPFSKKPSQPILVRRPKAKRTTESNSEDAVPLTMLVDATQAHQKYHFMALLDAIPDSTPLTIDLALPLQRETIIDQKAVNQSLRNSTLSLLHSKRKRGGIDNGPALLELIESIPQETKETILWVHGDQPVSINASTLKAIKFALEVRPGVALHSLAIETGSNYLVKGLVESPAFHSATFFTPSGIARQLHSILNPVALSYEWTRAENQEALPKGARRVESELAQQWAYHRTMQAHREGRWEKSDTALAADYRIVTPFTGAVVLETAQQFKEFGLNPNDPSKPKTTAVPEPEFYLMLAIVILAIYWKLRSRESAYA